MKFPSECITAPVFQNASSPYCPPSALLEAGLRLDGTAGSSFSCTASRRLDARFSCGIHRYPEAARFERLLASRYGVDPDQVIATAGADEALDRVCRALLATENNVILTSPTFEMIERYARLTGAQIRSVPWEQGDLPLEAILRAVDTTTAAIVIVSPNNPTGAVASLQSMQDLAAGAPTALLVLDGAYAEFADQDISADALRLGSVLLIRTLSKAWGLASLRVGYAIGPEPVINAMRSCGSPYAVSGPSLAIAQERLETAGIEMCRVLARVRLERRALIRIVRRAGGQPLPSQANFVFARFPNASWLYRGLAVLGISVRSFPNRPGLENALRITCPGNRADFRALVSALNVLTAPQALLFDLDGVLADVSRSYRQAIAATVCSFGAAISIEEIALAKQDLLANNDWLVTLELLKRKGIFASLSEVKDRFERYYQGEEPQTGLWQNEQALMTPSQLRALAIRLPIAIVTGRPRQDAERFLRHTELQASVSALICMEDGPPKPSPAPVLLALQRLAVQRAWLAGDTVDDMTAARRAGVLPIGILAPAQPQPEQIRHKLLAAGACCVLTDPSDIGGLLP